MVIIDILSGLGNILLNWNDMSSFASLHKIPVKYIWNKELQTMDDFHHYFQEGIGLDIVNGTVGCNDGVVLGIKCHDVFDSQKGKLKFIQTLESGEEYYQNRNAYFRWESKDLRHIRLNFDFLKSLTPSIEIGRQIDEYMSSNGIRQGECIGMHIRRTDKITCIQNSPDILFFNQIDQLVGENPNVKIFLCTDDDELKWKIKTSHPNNILTRENRPRYSIGSMDDAVVDMFILSMCSMIYGCDNSTFSEVASFISEIPLVRLVKESQP